MISWIEILIRLSLASLFGAMIGLERERKDWAAGMRTHMMVCVGSALTMIVSAYGFTEVLVNKNVVLDPSRIAAQVISGIGFIGAGTILFLRQGIIRGLTTASGLWTVAAIGLATGSGMYFAALITTILAIIILWVLQPVEKKFASRFRQRSLRIVTTDRTASVDIMNTIFSDTNVAVNTCSLDNADDEFIVYCKFKHVNEPGITGLISRLQAHSGVKEVTWNN